MKHLASAIFLLAPLFCGAFPQNDTTKRGYEERLETAKQIVACHEGDCNNDFLVPEEIECYNCNSRYIEECATNPSANLPRVKCKDPKDKCYTAILTLGATYRGCAKDIDVNLPAYKCNSSLCNVEVYPRDRLRCYQCMGKDCVKDFQMYLKPCFRYVEDDLCVTKVQDENNVIRECSSNLPASPHPEETCKGSGCNNQSAINTVECISCSETSNSNITSCARVASPDASGKCKLPKVETCTETTLLNRPSCFTYKMSGRVVRGCTKDAGKLALDTKNFETCEGQWCNNECIPIKCVSCDSRVNPECAKDANNLEPQLCSNETTCFIGHTSEGAIIRGCGSESKEAVQISSCSTDGCNKVNKVFPPATKRLECYKCVSTNLTECAKNPSPSLPRVYCKDANDQCATAVADGVTYRGCEKELNALANSILATCNLNLCNVEKFKVQQSDVTSEKKEGNNNVNNIINFYFGNMYNNSTDKVIGKLKTTTLKEKLNKYILFNVTLSYL